MNNFLIAVAGVMLLLQIYFWAVGLRGLLQSYSWTPSAEGGPDSSEGLPFISIIIPAHNEEENIQACLQSAFDQDYPNFEIILVDDRSTDATESIAADIGRNKSNFKFIKVNELPHGWTGKSHALDIGGRQASGEWLAFFDADSHIVPSALTRCHQTALDHKVSLVSLGPKFILKTFWEKALQPPFVVASSMLFPLAEVNDPNSPVASASGMFFLIKKSVYEKIGGHREVRGLAVEDIGIGKRVKAAGFGILFLNGRDLLETRMYTGFKTTLDGWIRILSASMNYNLAMVVKNLIIHILMSPFAAAFALYMFVPFLQSVFPILWFILPLIFALELLIVPPGICSQMGIPKRYAALMPLGNLILIWTYMVIIKKILMKDALEWNGTTYGTHLYRPAELDPARDSRKSRSAAEDF